MGKHTRIAKNKPLPTATVPVEATKDIDATLQETLEFLQGLLRAVRDADDVNPAILRESTGIARAIVQLSGEQRARRKAFVRDARALSLSAVMEYLRALGEIERHNVVRELSELDEGGSVLA